MIQTQLQRMMPTILRAVVHLHETTAATLMAGQAASGVIQRIRTRDGKAVAFLCAAVSEYVRI